MSDVAAVRIDGPLSPPHTVLVRGLARDPGHVYFLYVPTRGAEGAPLFVTVHGISRNAEEHARLFAPYAERYRVVLLAPLFPGESFPRYQRLGRDGCGERADRVLEEIVAGVGAVTGAATDKLYLFGFSGGGQFVHRYAMAYPSRVARYMVGAAGWYTYPNDSARYPRGIRPREDLPDVRFEPRDFLKVPGGVVIGERDIKINEALNKSPRITVQQGANRLERGLRWIEAMRDAAAALGLSTHYSYFILPGVGHSFRRAMTRSGMGDVVFNHLFGSGEYSGIRNE